MRERVFEVKRQVRRRRCYRVVDFRGRAAGVVLHFGRRHCWARQ